MKATLVLMLAAVLSAPAAVAPSDPPAPRVETAGGIVEGATLASGIHVFKGLPFAAPPVRELRWQPPQPPAPWEGVRRADRFAAQCMQQRVFGDMMFRNEGVSEDCLYLNVWTPRADPEAKLPVLVYFYGGGFVAGDGSEPRYDGESMAQKDIVVVTTSYRLGIFGLFAHPELTAESPHGASGNYTLMDQTAALRWVQDNIAAFGGDPARVTIAGESAGSASVSAQMASPLAQGLFAGAIGESGSVLGTLPPVPLAQAEAQGAAFAEAVGAPSLSALRALSAMELLEAAGRPGMPRFSMTVDGYFYPKSPADIFAAGEQAHVPLLVGWNSEEMTYLALLGQNEPTWENFEAVVRNLYGDRAADVLDAYAAATPDEVVQAATDLAGDRFIGLSTWRWAERHRQTGQAPVYRYYYAHPRPPMTPEMGDAVAGLAGGVVRGSQAPAPPPPRGAVHSAEIEYAMGNLATNRVYAWTDDDYRVSEVLQGYFANFVKTGDPNGPGLPQWPALGAEPDAAQTYMRIEVDSRAEPDQLRHRYLLLDEIAQ